MAPGVETEVQFHHAGFEAARSATDISAEKSAQEAIHKAVEEGIKNAMVSGDREDLYKALKFIEEQGHGLNNVENRYFAAYELAQGVNSNWAKEDIRNRIDSTYGERWTGKVKAMMAGVSEQTLAGKDAWYKNEWTRRTAKVLGKTAISAGIGYSIAGAVAVMGGPVTWGAVGAAALGSAVGRGAVEAYRAITGKERGMREKVNTDYLKRYDDVGKAAERILKLETNLRNAATDDERNQYQDAINLEYAKLITMTNTDTLTDTLAAQEQELRKTEIKAEKMANWGAVAGAVAGSAAHVLKGAYDVTHGGRMFDFDTNGVAHNVRQVTEAGHQLHGKFVYFLNPDEVANHIADPAHHWVTGGQTGHLLTENWGQILSALGKEALSGGAVVLPEAAQAIASSKGEAAAVQEMETRRQRITTGPGAEMAKIKGKIEKGTPELPTPEAPPDPNIQPGIKYLFEPPPRQQIELKPKDPTASSMTITRPELLTIFDVQPTHVVLERTTSHGPSYIEVKKEELAKGKKWEHPHYDTIEDWGKVNLFRPMLDQLKNNVGGKIQLRRRVTPTMAGLPSKNFEILKVDEDQNKINLVEAATGSTIEKKLSDIINFVELARPTEAADERDEKEKKLEAYAKKFSRKEGTTLRNHDVLNFTDDLKRGSSTIVARDSKWEIIDIDEDNFQADIRDLKTGKTETIGFDDILNKGELYDNYVHRELAAKPTKTGLTIGREGLRYRITQDQVWKFTGTDRGRLVSGHEYRVLPPRRDTAITDIIVVDNTTPRSRPFAIAKEEILTDFELS